MFPVIKENFTWSKSLYPKMGTVILLVVEKQKLKEILNFTIHY